MDFEVKFSCIVLDKCDFILEFYINQIVVCPVWCMIIYCDWEEDVNFVVRYQVIKIFSK